MPEVNNVKTQSKNERYEIQNETADVINDIAEIQPQTQHLPPSSRDTFFKFESAAAFAMIRPTSVEPVNATFRTSARIPEITHLK